MLHYTLDRYLSSLQRYRLFEQPRPNKKTKCYSHLLFPALQPICYITGCSRFLPFFRLAVRIFWLTSLNRKNSDCLLVELLVPFSFLAFLMYRYPVKAAVQVAQESLLQQTRVKQRRSPQAEDIPVK